MEKFTTIVVVLMYTKNLWLLVSYMGRNSKSESLGQQRENYLNSHSGFLMVIAKWLQWKVPLLMTTSCVPLPNLIRDGRSIFYTTL